MNKRLTVYIGYYKADSTIDANLHPQDQYEALYEYLRKCIEAGEDIVIYTNSPYILCKLTILQAYYTYGVKCDYFNYELDHNFECIERKSSGEDRVVNKYKEMISDENILNDYLGYSNSEFSDILDKHDELNKITNE